jgi:hypothetical protein
LFVTPVNPGHFVRSTFISEAGCRSGGENVANYRFVVRSTSRRGKSARPFRFKYLQTGQFQVVRQRWNEANWHLDADALVMPNGHRVPLKDILQWQLDKVDGRHDFTGQWPGWRVRQQWLIAPGGTIRRGRIAEHVLRHVMQMSEWEQAEMSRRQLRLFQQ